MSMLVLQYYIYKRVYMSLNDGVVLFLLEERMA